MNLKQNPFSIYDFLGYFTPGAIFLYGIIFIIGHAKGAFPFDYIAQYLSFDKPEIYIPFVLTAYSAGHLLSFLSSITVERYSIWALGYPSKYLLGLEHPGYFSVKEQRWTRLTMRTLVAILLAPICLMDFLLGWKAGMRFFYAKSLDKLLIAILSRKIDRLLKEHAESGNLAEIGANAIDSDFFKYAYHYALENAPAHTIKMQNYVALYGFLRTLTLISVIFFWGLVWHFFRGNFGVNYALWLIVSATILSYILFMGFVKFYRRFSLEALMAMAVSYKGICKS